MTQLVLWVMESVAQVQIRVEAICVSFFIINLEQAINPSALL